MGEVENVQSAAAETSNITHHSSLVTHYEDCRP